ncbi:hypothetical protein BB561_002685 [Smittium simulii]|uniref:Uncharacterized protein n=1 Tax=Smittium simulii TaxID=133385 RepID=A0A2T9YPL0_9FUNG|nr:hypothetical protein BB561_002685 [Smittium simulii]
MWKISSNGQTRQELSLTDLNIKMAVERTRAFGKCFDLKTWIADPIKCPYKNQYRKKNDKSQISKCIAGIEVGPSCNWMGLGLVYPELKTHIHLCLKYEMEHTGLYDVMQKECPFCRNISPETIENTLLECSRFQELRTDILVQYINIYRARVATKPPLSPASILMRLVAKMYFKQLSGHQRNRLTSQLLVVGVTSAIISVGSCSFLPKPKTSRDPEESNDNSFSLLISKVSSEKA